MARYIIVSLCSGILFGVLDGLLNGNPLARELYSFLRPIAKDSINVPVGLTIDLAYGFAMAALFLLLYRGLPGKSGLSKGLAFAAIAWFFRVLMGVVSEWMTIQMPLTAVAYSLVAGLVEMGMLGALYGLCLRRT